MFILDVPDILFRLVQEVAREQHFLDFCSGSERFAGAGVFAMLLNAFMLENRALKELIHLPSPKRVFLVPRINSSHIFGSYPGSINPL